MSLDYLKTLISEGHEIEFRFNNTMYSIIYGIFEGDEVLSICEFYKESIEVLTYDELLNAKINGERFGNIWKKLDENDIWIY